MTQLCINIARIWTVYGLALQGMECMAQRMQGRRLWVEQRFPNMSMLPLTNCSASGRQES